MFYIYHSPNCITSCFAFLNDIQLDVIGMLQPTPEEEEYVQSIYWLAIEKRYKEAPIVAAVSSAENIKDLEPPAKRKRTSNIEDETMMEEEELNEDVNRDHQHFEAQVPKQSQPPNTQLMQLSNDISISCYVKYDMSCIFAYN